MPFCPNCGTEVGNAKFCPSCGAQQGFGQSAVPPPSYGGTTSGPNYPPPQPRSGVKYDAGICVLICCCLSPIGAIIYYLLTEHPENNQGY